MKKIGLLVLAVFIGITFKSYSQENETESNKNIRPFHMSFITPLGTNGMESDKITNNFSLNMFAGYSGGLKGCELAGFANIIKGETQGLQIAGFGNTNRSNVEGCQISGFSNVCLGKTVGLQIAGFANVVKDSAEAIQISGFVNAAKALPQGGQISGFANINNGDANGLQITGFANINNGNSKAIQIAGFSNVNKGDLTGVQISGFVNRVKKLNGVQIGFINIADTIEDGISLGFLNYVKKGYRTIEVNSNETFYCAASFKTGTERLYNILSVGAKIDDNDIVWGWGYGVGTMFSVHEKVKLNFDVVAYHISDGEWWTNRVNMLNKVNLTANYQINDFVTVFGGPTWNIHVSDINDDEGNPVDFSLVSWSSYSKTTNKKNVTMYPGFTVGVKL